MKELIKNIKNLNHAWCCTKDKCNCDSITSDDDDLGNRIIQEMWNKDQRLIKLNLKGVKE